MARKIDHGKQEQGNRNRNAKQFSRHRTRFSYRLNQRTKDNKDERYNYQKPSFS